MSAKSGVFFTPFSSGLEVPVCLVSSSETPRPPPGSPGCSRRTEPAPSQSTGAETEPPEPPSVPPTLRTGSLPVRRTALLARLRTLWTGGWAGHRRINSGYGRQRLVEKVF